VPGSEVIVINTEKFLLSVSFYRAGMGPGEAQRKVKNKK
jgi:hypothetical protein